MTGEIIGYYYPVQSERDVLDSISFIVHNKLLLIQVFCSGNLAAIPKN
jgi:hypothetical protein